MVSSVWRLYSRAQWNPGWAEEITFLLIPSLDRQNTIWFGYTSGTRRWMGLAVWIPVTFTTSHTLLYIYLYILYIYMYSLYFFHSEFQRVAHYPAARVLFLCSTKQIKKNKQKLWESFRSFVLKVFWGLIGFNFAKIHWLVGQYFWDPSNHEAVLGPRPSTLLLVPLRCCRAPIRTTSSSLELLVTQSRTWIHW